MHVAWVSNGFLFLLSLLFHLSGGLMGADLTTGAGTSAGKNASSSFHPSCTNTHAHTVHETYSSLWRP